MIQRLNHIAIAVANLEDAIRFYKDTMQAHVSAPQDLPEHGVTTVFVHLENTKIELICPLGDGSPISSFVDKNPNGAIHHLCFEVEDIKEAQEHVTNKGVRSLGTIKNGAHDKPVLFLHPKDCLNCLIELEEV